MVRARYGERHVMLADIENNIGVAWEGEGDLERAREHYARSVEMIEALLGEDHPSVGGRLLNLAFIELRHGDVSAAEGHIRRALALLDGSAARHVDNVAKGLGLLAVVLLESQRCEEAIPTSAEALQMRRDQYSPRHRKIATHLIDHARGLIRCDQAALALPYLTEAREILGRGDAPPRLLQRSWFNEGWALREIGRLEEAVAAHERALELAEREHGREHIDVAAVLAELARDHRARGELEAARAAAEESVAIYGRGGAELADAAAARSVLAELAVEHDP
jgi:tetratricopeptide (TPR) repeat protein